MRIRLAALALLSGACATLANGTAGLDNVPTSKAGPFRLLTVSEMHQPERIAPRAVDDGVRQLRAPSVVDIDGDPVTLEVEGYFAASADDAEVGSPSIRIMMLLAIDGRDFEKADPVLVLEPQHDWEGGVIGAPSVLAPVGRTQRILYYEAEGGIGRAVAAEASTLFDSADTPVLAPEDVPWARGGLHSPSIVELPDSTFRLYFAAEDADGPVLGVASSEDGIDFEDEGVVLRTGSSALSVDGAFVGAPFAVMGVSPEARTILYVYYTAIANDGRQTISMAARFVDDGAPEGLDKSVGAMYGPSGSVGPDEPCVVRFEDFSLLFCSQRTARDTPDPIVVVGVSPGDAVLPPPVLTTR